MSFKELARRDSDYWNWFTHCVRNEMFLKVLHCAFFAIFWKQTILVKKALLKFRCREGAGLGEPWTGSGWIFFFFQTTKSLLFSSLCWLELYSKARRSCWDFKESLKQVWCNIYCSLTALFWLVTSVSRSRQENQLKSGKDEKKGNVISLGIFNKKFEVHTPH